jgi:hypothetical protein
VRRRSSPIRNILRAERQVSGIDRSSIVESKTSEAVAAFRSCSANEMKTVSLSDKKVSVGEPLLFADRWSSNPNAQTATNKKVSGLLRALIIL